MRVNKEQMVEEYNLRAFGAKGWVNSNVLSCPWCGGEGDKFGILFTENGTGVCNCFRCEIRKSIFALLKQINRTDLIIGDGSNFTYKDKLEILLKEVGKEEVDLECEEINKPLGWRQILEDDYLEGRGWTEKEFVNNHAGISTLDPKRKKMITFLLYEDEKLVGWLSRSKKSKEWHKQNLKNHKAGKASLVLRYDNSRDTEFEKIVGGYNDIIEGETDTVLLVEGIMDKANTDKVLQLYDSPEIKCCFTFGCKLSDAQMVKIFKKGVENIILLYDPGTIQQVKSTSLRLMKFFDIKIGELRNGRDPGEMNLQDFENVFVSLRNPIEYFANRLQKIELR